MIEAALTALVALGRDSGPAICWSFALSGGLAYAVRAARAAGLDPRAAYWAGVCGLGMGVCGSRLLGMVVYHDGAGPSVLAIVAGGHSYYGGLVAGLAAALAYLALRRAPLLRHADAMAPAAALGYAIGRVGCFFNGCDYGVLAHGGIAVRYPSETEAFVAQVEAGLIPGSAVSSLPVVPTQLLHAALGMLLFLLLRRRSGEAGERAGVFVLGYGLGRFALETVRGDFTPALGPLSIHQAISVLLVAAGTFLLARAYLTRMKTTVAASVP